MVDFLGKRLPRSHDSELSKIQSSVLAVMHPLTSAWQHLADGGLEDDPELLVPGTEVMSLVQCTLCMLGNASELISQTRRSKILEAVNPSWGKYGPGDFPSCQGHTLWGQLSVYTHQTGRKRCGSLKGCLDHKAVQKRRFTLDLETGRAKEGTVFSRGPSCQVRWQAGQKLFPVQLTKQPQARRTHPIKAISGSSETRLQATLPRASSPSESPTQAVLKLIDRLPDGTLGSLGIKWI